MDQPLLPIPANPATSFPSSVASTVAATLTTTTLAPTDAAAISTSLAPTTFAAPVATCASLHAAAHSPARRSCAHGYDEHPDGFNP